jgi:tetratricopeptide (TPR) repeat protein
VKRLGVLFAALALLVAGAWVRWRLADPAPVAALYLDPEPSAAWKGISEQERAGLITLLQEALELDRRNTVLQEKPPEQSPPTWRAWKVVARRRGSDLELELRGGQGVVTEAAGPPREAIRRVFDALDFGTVQLDRLLPAEAAGFWELADLTAARTFDELAPTKARLLALAERHPHSAAVLYRAAYTSMRLLLVEASTQPGSHATCEQLYHRTLEALPDYPRALYHYCRYKTDVGSGRESLEVAMRLRDAFPNNPLAYGALAYAARNAGLLEAARVALAERERLVGGLVADPGLGENTYLYEGDLDRFEASLVTHPDTAASPIRVFYQGYARLLRGDRTAALALFREAQSYPGRVVHFEALSRVYEYALTERGPEALRLLQELREARTRLLVPDGEFTFKLAEAFAFLGALSEAVDTAHRAFAQGFGCTRWYLKAPFLAPLQPLPKWQVLLKHLQEREAPLAARFPPKAFRRK